MRAGVTVTKPFTQLVYDKRPLACKSFPFEEMRLGWKASTKCPVIARQMKNKDTLALEPPRMEMDAAYQMGWYIWGRAVSGSAHVEF